MIKLLQRHIASLEGVINTLRRELAESRGELAPAPDPATPTASALRMMTAASPNNPQSASVPKSDTARAASG